MNRLKMNSAHSVDIDVFICRAAHRHVGGASLDGHFTHSFGVS